MALTQVIGTGLGTINDNIVFGTASKGIYLGVTTATASNLLDDYEEGTWTPALKFGGTGGTDNTDSSAGEYTKIGNLVQVQLQINLENSVSGSGAAVITGLPFAFLNRSALFQKYKIFGNDYMVSTEASAGGSANGTYLDCYLEASGTGDALASFTEGSVHSSNSGKKVFMAFTYTTN